MQKNKRIQKALFFSLVITLLTSFTLLQIKTNKNILIGKSRAITPLLKGSTYKLQTNVYDALEKMKKDALKKGVKIHVISAYRSFEHQNRIWKKKYNVFRNQGLSVKETIKKITEYTAIPGTSRHHWGTEVDLSNFKNSRLKNKTATKKRKYEDWMQENAHKYGFYLVYTNNKYREGYKHESWHYSYRAISKFLLIEYLKLDIAKVLKTENIAGSTIFTKKYIEKYIEEHVLGINDYLF
ncbi:MAG: M15 family metallopeptidase [Flavobacteriaceae bacterium]|nr:M15 family metallopeptidase [Flavobacteriaceae bacterium]